MNKEIKRIVAREGLALLGIVTLGIVIAILGASFKLEAILFTGIVISFYGYPFYLLIRFIFWAIGILKEK